MGAFENIEELKTLFKKCAEDEKDVWIHSNNETSGIRFEARKNVLCQYQKEIEQLAGDELDLCKDLIDANKDIQFKEYHEVFDNIKLASEWRNVLPLIVDNFQRLKWVEKKEREEGWNYYIINNGIGDYGCIEQDLILKMVVNGKVLCQKIEGIYKENRDLYEYAILKTTFEYKVCSPLSEYIYNKGVEEKKVMRSLLETLAQAVCLYIALKNEKVKLYRQNGYYPDMETKAAKTSNKAKKTKQPREVFTERATKYFEKAEKEGYLEKVGDKYKWTYRGGTVALVYFFIRIYEPQSPPFKQLQPLFGVEGLTSSRRNLEQTDWYKDEMTREAMTPEELARERRERKLKEPKEWFPELKSFFED